MLEAGRPLEAREALEQVLGARPELRGRGGRARPGPLPLGRRRRRARGLAGLPRAPARERAGRGLPGDAGTHRRVRRGSRPPRAGWRRPRARRPAAGAGGHERRGDQAYGEARYADALAEYRALAAGQGPTTASGPSSGPRPCTPESCARAPTPTSGWPAKTRPGRTKRPRGWKGWRGRPSGPATPDVLAGGGDRPAGGRPRPPHRAATRSCWRSARTRTRPSWWRCSRAPSRRPRRRRPCDSLLTLYGRALEATAGCGQALLQFRAVLRRSAGQRLRAARPAEESPTARTCSATAPIRPASVEDAALWFAESARMDSTTPTGRRALLRYADARLSQGDTLAAALAFQAVAIGGAADSMGEAAAGAPGRAGHVNFRGRLAPALERDDSAKSRWVLLLGLAACGGSTPAPRRRADAGHPGSRRRASAGELDTLWAPRAARRSGTASGATRSSISTARCSSSHPAIRGRRRRTSSGRGPVRAWAATSRPRREFRKVSDDTPNDPLAPEALLRAGDVYADLWRRPELDPSYGQTALATYQELLNRYPGAPRGQAGPDADRRSAGALRLQGIQGRALLHPAQGVRLGDPLPQGSGRHLSAELGGARRADPPGPGVPDARIQGRRPGDLRIHPALPPKAPGRGQGVSRHPAARRPCDHARSASIGLLGGSFDPVHHGHLIVGRVAAEALGLDELRFVPGAGAAVQAGRHAASPADRAAMLDLAVAGTPGLRSSALELRAPGPLLHGGYPPGAPDAASPAPSSPCCSAPTPPPSSALAPGRRSSRAWRGSWSSRGPGADLPGSPRIGATVEVPAVEISATEIRRRVREGRPIRYWVPDAVAEYVARHRLYLDPE